MKMYKNISMTPVGKTIDNRCVWKIIVDGKEVHQPLLSLSKFEYGIWINGLDINDYVEGFVWSGEKEKV